MKRRIKRQRRVVKRVISFLASNCIIQHPVYTSVFNERNDIEYFKRLNSLSEKPEFDNDMSQFVRLASHIWKKSCLTHDTPPNKTFQTSKTFYTSFIS